MGIDDKLRSKNGTTVRYFLTDHLGSTEALADASGAIVSSTSYDSFGNATSNIATSYRYTGREYDAETGLYYYRNRWYDPEIGRFISTDPIGFAGGDINLYGYVSNNPLSFVDPLGKYACKKGQKQDPRTSGAKLSGFVPPEGDRILKALSFALNERCETAFKEAGLKPASEQLATGITYVHGDRLLMDYQDKLWTPKGSKLAAKMRKYYKAARMKSTVLDISLSKTYQGRHYAAITRPAFKEKFDHLSAVVVHSLIHTGGQEGINRWWDDKRLIPSYFRARHDLERMGRTYDKIMSACSEKGSRQGKSRY